MPFSTFVSFITYSLISVCSADKTVGYPEWLQEEYSNADCKAEGVPTWIEGTFVHHQCGAFGGPKGDRKYSISHFYDCLGMLNAFTFDNGRVSYTSKYFDTTAYRAWSPKRRSADAGTLDVSWKTLFSVIDQKSFDDQASVRSLDQSTSADASPNGGLWSVDENSCSLTTFSDAPTMYHVQLRNGQIQEASTASPSLLPPLPPGTVALHHSAHSHEDADGNLWGAILAAKSKTANIYEISRIIYKVEADTKTTTLFDSAMPIRTVDLSRCYEDGKGGWTYSADGLEDIGYVSEVVTTKSYAILIENSYVFNPCALLEKARASATPFLSTWFTWKSALPKFHLINKSDGTLKRTATATSVAFVSRTVNVVENKPADNGYVVIDAMTYPDSSVLTREYSLQRLMTAGDSWPTDASLKRYAIDPNTGRTAQVENLLPSGTSSRISSEFATINKLLYGDGEYSFAYLLIRPFSDKSEIWKVDVRNSRPTLEWAAETGVYPAGEPTFVSRSNRTSAEDEGALLVPAFNSNSKKGLILVLDPITMKQIGRVEAPGLITYGTYSRFLPTCTSGALSQMRAGCLLLCYMLCRLFMPGVLLVGHHAD